MIPPFCVWAHMEMVGAVPVLKSVITGIDYHLYGLESIPRHLPPAELKLRNLILGTSGTGISLGNRLRNIVLPLN